jgi:hypothetical protein
MRLKVQAEWDLAIFTLVKEQKIPCQQKIKLDSTIYFSTDRRRDRDNYITTYKLCQDGLKDALVVFDDDASRVTFSAPVLKVGQPPRTELVISSVSPSA